jgi:hypothetical protein
MWALGLRTDVNHLSANTTGVCEGYHSFIKDIFAGIVRRARRLDHMLHILLHHIRAHYTARTHAAAFGAISQASGAHMPAKIRGAASCVGTARDCNA